METAEHELNTFSKKWDARYPTISSLWKRHWERRVIPFFAYPAEIRRIVYTSNAVESLNLSLRTIIKARGSFPSVNKWEIVQHWKAALSRWHDCITRIPADCQPPRSARLIPRLAEDGSSHTT